MVAPLLVPLLGSYSAIIGPETIDLSIVALHLSRHLSLHLAIYKYNPARSIIPLQRPIIPPGRLTHHLINYVHQINYPCILPHSPLPKLLPPLPNLVAAAQVLLRWALQKGIAPVTTSSRPGRMADYLAAAAAGRGGPLALSAEEVAEVDAAGARQPSRKYWAKEFGG
jgi:hypothetical protein